MNRRENRCLDSKHRLLRSVGKKEEHGSHRWGEFGSAVSAALSYADEGAA